MEKISLSIFSLLLFPSGMVLKPSARVENNISPFVLVGEKGRIPSCWEKMFLTSPTEVFFVVCWLQKVQSLIYAQTRGRLDWMFVSQSHKSPAGSEWQVGWEEKSWFFWHIGAELLGLCPGPSCPPAPGWHQGSCCLFGSTGRGGEFLTWRWTTCPFGGLRRTTLCPSVESRKIPIPNWTPSLLSGDAAYGSSGLKLCRSWVSGSLLFLPVKQRWNVGSEFPQWLFLSSWDAAVGNFGKSWGTRAGKGGEWYMDPLRLTLWVTPASLPGFSWMGWDPFNRALCLKQRPGLEQEELLLPGLSSCTYFTSSMSWWDVD